MIFDNDLISDLLAKSKSSPRQRMNLDLRNSADDQSQRMLNAMLPGTQLPIHRHPNTSETVVILSGRMEEVLYDEHGAESARFILAPASDDGCHGLQIPAGTWHTVIVYEPTVIIEMKEGPFKPLGAEDIFQKS